MAISTSLTCCAVSLLVDALGPNPQALVGSDFGFGHIDRELATVYFFPIEGLDGCIRFGLCRHFDKSKSAFPTAIAIRWNCYGNDLPVLSEQLFHISFGKIE